MARISAILFSRHCHRAIIFALALLQRAPPLSVRTSGAVALKVVQVPSTVNCNVKNVTIRTDKTLNAFET